MATSSKPQLSELLDSVALRVGPDFGWLRMEQHQSHIMVRAGDLSFPPVLMGSGIYGLTEALGQAIGVTPAKAEELILHGALAIDEAFRRAIEPGLHPLVDQLRKMLDGVHSYGRTVPAVVLDLPGPPIPGLTEAFRSVFPGQQFVALSDLAIASPAELPSFMEAPSLDPSGVPIVTARAIDQPIRPLEIQESGGNAFLAWMAALAVLSFLGAVAFLFHSMNRVNDHLTMVILELEKMRQERVSNAPFAVPAPAAPLPALPLPFVAPLRPLSLPPAPSFGGSGGRIALGPLPALPPVRGMDTATTSEGGRLFPNSFPGSRAMGQTPLLSTGAPAPPRQILSQLPVPLAGEQAIAPSFLLPVPGPGGSSPPPTPTAPSEANAPGPVSLPAPGPDPLPSPGATTKVSLSEILRRSSEHSYLGEAAGFRRAASDAVSAGAQAPYHLQWGFNTNVSTSSNILTTTPGTAPTSGSFYGSMDLDIAGRKKWLNASARAQHAQATAEIADANQQAGFSAASAYLDAQLAKEQVEAQKEILRVERDEWQVVTARMDAGFATRLDLAEVANRIAASQSELAAAITTEEQLEVRLGASIQAAPGTRIAPLGADPILSLTSGGLETATARTLAMNRSDVIAAGARVKAERAAVEIARKSKNPQLRTYGGVQVYGAGERGIHPVVGVNLSLPFGDGGQADAALRDARASLGEANTLYNQSIQNAATEIRSAQIAVERTQPRMAAAAAALSAGQEALRVAEQRYKAGYATFSEVLQTESQLRAALRDNTIAREATFRAQLDLLHAAGRLGPLQAQRS